MHTVCHVAMASVVSAPIRQSAQSANRDISQKECVCRAVTQNAYTATEVTSARPVSMELRLTKMGNAPYYAHKAVDHAYPRQSVWSANPCTSSANLLASLVPILSVVHPSCLMPANNVKFCQYCRMQQYLCVQ